MANMTIYEALGALCSFLDMSSSIGCFSEDELEDQDDLEDEFFTNILDEEDISDDEIFTDLDSEDED